RIGDAYRITEKQERYEQIDAIRDEVISTLLAEDESLDEGEIIEIFSGLEKKIVRARVLAGEPRIDGREKDMVRA
ncbi:hypothetical protein, partial [Stenotrophomonas maltophilia]